MNEMLRSVNESEEAKLLDPRRKISPSTGQARFGPSISPQAFGFSVPLEKTKCDKHLAADHDF